MHQRVKRTVQRSAVMLGALLAGTMTVSLFAAEIYPKASRKKGDLSANTIIASLDKLLTEEQQLLQAIEEVKNELAIVKVRAAMSKRVVLPTGENCP